MTPGGPPKAPEIRKKTCFVRFLKKMFLLVYRWADKFCQGFDEELEDNFIVDDDAELEEEESGSAVEEDSEVVSFSDEDSDAEARALAAAYDKRASVQNETNSDETTDYFFYIFTFHHPFSSLSYLGWCGLWGILLRIECGRSGRDIRK